MNPKSVNPASSPAEVTIITENVH